MPNIEDEYKDIEKKTEEWKEREKKKNNDWENKLTSEQKEAVNRLTDKQAVNTLKETLYKHLDDNNKLKIDELPKETKEKIERIDKSLETAPTLTEDLTFFLNLESVKDENDPTKPNLDDPYEEPFYLIGDMKKTDLENEEDMRVELTIPKEVEESVAYIENDGQEQIVFKRGKSYVLDKKSAKTSTENGKDVLVVKAELVKEER
ncbi:hypothetical protein ACLBXI_26990, partial [Bacillus cereus]